MHVRDVRQLFFIDETGCNRHTLLRAYGYSPRGAPVSRAAGVDSAARGDNHSVIIAIGAGGSGVLAHRTLVGRGRGTRRTDFCEFLRSSVAPAMLAAAARASLPRTAPLYLMMDNASIHKGMQVTQALRDGARHHCRRLRRRRSSIQLSL